MNILTKRSHKTTQRSENTHIVCFIITFVLSFFPNHCRFLAFSFFFMTINSTFHSVKTLLIWFFTHFPSFSCHSGTIFQFTLDLMVIVIAQTSIEDDIEDKMLTKLRPILTVINLLNKLTN